MPITTVLGHVSRAMDFFNKQNLFFAFGKQTPWEDEDFPDILDPEITEIVEPLGYKMIENKYMVVPDNENGTIMYRDSRWRTIPFDKAIEEKSRWVYIECFLRYDELPLGTYRQIGVYSNLIRADETPIGKMALVDNEIKDHGILEFVDNIRRVTRQLEQREHFSLIIEF